MTIGRVSTGHRDRGERYALDGQLALQGIDPRGVVVDRAGRADRSSGKPEQPRSTEQRRARARVAQRPASAQRALEGIVDRRRRRASAGTRTMFETFQPLRHRRTPRRRQCDGTCVTPSRPPCTLQRHARRPWRTDAAASARWDSSNEHGPSDPRTFLEVVRGALRERRGAFGYA